MAAHTTINGREAHWDEDNSVWVWTDTDERVATPYQKAVTIMIQAVSRWQLHNEAPENEGKPLALETVIKEAMTGVFALVRNTFFNPGVTFTRKDVDGRL